MNNVICPISNERIPSHIPRITAFFVVVLIISYALTGWFVILVFLLLDFIARATKYSKLSIIAHLAQNTSKRFNLQSNNIDKAPKIFAARLGAIMFIAATILHASGFTNAAIITTLLVAVLATLECVFNFCVGCVIYSALIFPFFTKE